MTMRFDEDASRRVEAIYRTPDIVAQRAATLAALALRPSERVVDLGCGPGMLAEAMLAQVGASGAVDAIDVSDSMLAIAQRRCAVYTNASFQIGDVTQLPYEEGRFDVGVCTQVYEYVTDVDLALRELHRVLKPGARAVIVDTDWESCVWASSDDARMRKVLETWDRHCPHPNLPRVLATKLARAGFSDVTCESLTLLNTAFDANTYSHAMIEVIARYAGKKYDEAAAKAWTEDLRERGARGEWFFSLNRYQFCARRA